jgi:NADPH-dependent glutamate synthase beta subunit-like oxidoreductase
MAIGEKADLTGFSPELGLKIGNKGWPEGAHPDSSTDLEGVFAAGGRSVVHAMAAGSKAAEAIDTYLCRKEGRSVAEKPDPFGGAVSPPRVPEGYSAPAWKP